MEPGTPAFTSLQGGPSVQWAGRCPPQESQKESPPTQALKHQPCDPSVPDQSPPTPLRSSTLNPLNFSPHEACDGTARHVKIEEKITAQGFKVDSPFPTSSLATENDTFTPSVTEWESDNVPPTGLYACAPTGSTASAREMTRTVIDNRLGSQLFRQDNVSSAAVTPCECTNSNQSDLPPKRSKSSGWNPGFKRESLDEVVHPSIELSDDVASSDNTRASKRMKVSHGFSGWFGKRQRDP